MENSMLREETGGEKGFYKLSWLQRIGFGSGDMAQNLIYNTVSTYLLFFYTNVFGLNPGSAATMFLVVRIIDAVWDPIVGTIVDKHTTRFGKYRGYLILVGLPLSIFAILVFWNGFSGSLLYAYITYVGLSMLYTWINVPYGALNASLTRDNDEITKLTSTRMFLANLGGLAVAYGVPVLVKLFSADGSWDTKASASGWLITMTIYAVVGFAILIFCFTQTKERVVMEVEKQDEVKVSDLLTEFKRNKPLRVLAFFFITAFAMMSIGNAGGAYYMQYVVKASDSVQWFNALGSIPAFIFLPLVPSIKKAIGKKQLFMVFLGIAVIGMMALYFIPNPQDHVTLVLIAQFIKSTGVIVATGYMWALVPEVISYGELQSGRRISGIVNALTGFFFKFGMALGGVIPGFVLSITGYNANSEAQSAFTQEGILWLVAVLPAILLIVAMIIISKYDITDERYLEISREIESRKDN
ncbi:MFS transporter [Listeria booriae]|uniref:MFS transporter n=2 Tax=Listeria TaxID=1637 RepID=A0A7X0XFD8_9LIST|nr:MULTISPECIES: MFS transporter [Listeria]EUJ44869.1 sugar (glycoside-Pentoside-Hexuronide) transporter [Listeria riparia FSL S10-1204]MBC1290841.1 MFS transporter [Listeria booriae]MBC1334612.1 MFS transporter [Listeria booriae]MBC1492943.1 MFS transporter [Listeria booriae]MBC1504521.1 MFS transporter [Listeria booriae]